MWARILNNIHCYGTRRSNLKRHQTDGAFNAASLLCKRQGCCWLCCILTQTPAINCSHQHAPHVWAWCMAHRPTQAPQQTEMRRHGGEGPPEFVVHVVGWLLRPKPVYSQTPDNPNPARACATLYQGGRPSTMGNMRCNSSTSIKRHTLCSPRRFTSRPVPSCLSCICSRAWRQDGRLQARLPSPPTSLSLASTSSPHPLAVHLLPLLAPRSPIPPPIAKVSPLCVATLAGRADRRAGDLGACSNRKRRPSTSQSRGIRGAQARRGPTQIGFPNNVVHPRC